MNLHVCRSVNACVSVNMPECMFVSTHIGLCVNVLVRVYGVFVNVNTHLDICICLHTRRPYL